MSKSDFVDFLRGTINLVVAGSSTRAVVSESYYGILLQLQGTPGFQAQLQGSSQHGTDTPLESAWTTIATYTADGLYNISPLPSMLRVKVTAGTVTICRGDLFNSPINLNEAIQNSEKALADIVAAADRMQTVAGTRSLGRAPTTGDAAGTYRWIDGSGNAIDIAWNGSAETGRTPALANASAVAAVKTAIGNLALTALAARAQAEGPQFADGSRWVWAASGTPNGGTIVAASGGGVWKREYAGSTVYSSWFGMVPDYDWTTNTGTDNMAAFKRMINSGASVCVLEDSLQGYLLGTDAAGALDLPVGVTIRGSGHTNYCTRHQQMPYAKLVIKQQTHPVMKLNHNVSLQRFMFVYPTMNNDWVSSSTGGVKDLKPDANPTVGPVITVFPPAITGKRAVAGQSCEGVYMEGVGQVGGTTMLDTDNGVMSRMTIREPFGYTMGDMFKLGKAIDSVRMYDPQLSPAFLPGNTTIDFISWIAKNGGIALNFFDKVDDFKCVSGLLYGWRIGVNQDPPAGSPYITGGSFIDLCLDAVGIGYRIGGFIPGFGMRIIGGFITPCVGPAAGKAAFLFDGPASGGSTLDIMGLHIYGDTDPSVAYTTGKPNTHFLFQNYARNVRVNWSTGYTYDYTTGDAANDGMGGFWYADSTSAPDIRWNIQGVARHDGRVINTISDGLYTTGGGNSAPASNKGFMDRAAIPALTGDYTGLANPTGLEFNKLLNDVKNIRQALASAGLAKLLP